MSDNPKQDADKVRQILDDLGAAAEHAPVKNPEEAAQKAVIMRLINSANDLLDVLASSEAGAGAGVKRSPFPTDEAHRLSLPPPVKPRYACDGSAQCALSDYSLKKCRHFGPHERGPDCGQSADTRCSNCPPPHGICKEVKA